MFSHCGEITWCWQMCKQEMQCKHDVTHVHGYISVQMASVLNYYE